MESILAYGTAEENESIRRGEKPDDPRTKMKAVSPEDIPTLSKTDSAYRQKRNRIFREIEARRAAGGQTGR